MLIVAIAAVAATLVLYLAHRIGRLFAASLSMIAVAAAALVLALVAIARDFRDADGFFDCCPNRSAIQDLVGVTVFAAPIVFIVAVVALVVTGSFGAATRD